MSFSIISVGIRVLMGFFWEMKISKIYTLSCLLVCHISSYAENKIGPFLKTQYFWQSVYTCSSMDLKIRFYFKNSGLITKVQVIQLNTQKWMVCTWISPEKREKKSLEFTDAGAQLELLTPLFFIYIQWIKAHCSWVSQLLLLSFKSLHSKPLTQQRSGPSLIKSCPVFRKQETQCEPHWE